MAKINIRNRNLGKLDKNGKPKSPNWEYRFEAAKIEGKRKSISKAGFRTKKEAEEAGAKAMAEYNSAGAKFEPSEMSVSDYLDYWMDTYVVPSCKYNTYLSYRNIIENHLKPKLGIYKIKALTPIQLQEYVNELYKSGLKRNTLNNIIGTLTGALNYAVLPAQILQSNPAQYIKHPKLSQERTEPNRFIISPENFEKMLSEFPVGHPHRYALMIGYYTGMRIGEVFALTWQDIDLKEATIDVNKTILRRNYNPKITKVTKLKQKKEEMVAWYFGDPKTKSSFRKIKIGETLLAELKEFRTIQLRNRMLYGEYYNITYKQNEKDEKGNTIERIVQVQKCVPVNLPTVELLMCFENGTYTSTDSFKHSAYIIHHKLKMDFNFHSLRHTHATMLIESGVSPKAVQARLGHADIETTLQTYTHSTDKMELDAVDVFEQIAKRKKA